MLGIGFHFPVDFALFVAAEFCHGFAKAFIRNEVTGIGLHRLIAALDFVRSLGAGFDGGEAVVDRVFYCLIVAGLEMQEFEIPRQPQLRP